MDTIGRFECSKKHFSTKVQNICGSQPFITPFHGILPQLPASLSWWEKSGRWRGGTGAVELSPYVEVVVGLLPVLPAGGVDMCTRLHSAGTLSFAHSLQGRPDRWNWAGCDGIFDFQFGEEPERTSPYLRLPETAKAGLRINPECSTQENPCDL